MVGVSGVSATIAGGAVSNGIAVPLTGWLMGRFGVVRTFVVSLLLFTLASLLCGIAWSLPALIAFRVLQGAVSGPMIPGSQALLISIFPHEKRTTALGWVAAVEATTLLGGVIGYFFLTKVSMFWLGLIMAHVGGGFVYLATHAVLGEMLKHGKKLVLTSFSLGVALIGILNVALRVVG